MLRDGNILPAVDLIFGFTGGGDHNTEDEYLSSADFTSQFQDLLDVSQVAAVQVGRHPNSPGMTILPSGALPRDGLFLGN